MAAPTWFNYELYMTNKLTQMQKADPAYTMNQLVASFKAAGFGGDTPEAIAEGAYNHFVAYGANEDVAPNAFFNATEYYEAKAAKFFGKAPSAVTAADVANVKALITAAGMNAWSHYEQYGSQENVNPSNNFSSEKYMAAKLVALQAAEPDANWDMPKLVEAFKAAGLSAMEHFFLYGNSDAAGEIGTAAYAAQIANPATGPFFVPENQKVNPANVGKTFMLTTGPDNIVGTAGNDTIVGLIDGTTAANSTFSAVDSIDGAGGTNTLNVTLVGAAAALPAASISNIQVLNVRNSAALNSSDLSLISGLTTFNADRSTQNITTTNMGKGGQYGIIGDGVISSSGAYGFGYATGADVATLNVSGGTKGSAAVTFTGADITSTVINSNGTAANTLGSIRTAATSTTTTINASSNLTTTLTTTADTKLVATGTGVIDLSGAALANNLVTVDASAMTAGGLKVGAGTSTAFKFTGGAGNDQVATGAVLATGLVDAGAGTADRLVVTNTAHIDATAGKLYKNFEQVQVNDGASVNMDNLASTNSIDSVIINQGAGATGVTNMTAAQAANVTVMGTGAGVVTFGIKGATNPGQIDTLKVLVDDGATAAANVTLTAPVMAGIENLELTTKENLTITALTGATALTNVKVMGTGTVDITTGIVSFAPNSTFDFSGVTNTVDFNASAATNTGLFIKGSATKVNTLVGTGQNDAIVGGAGNDIITGGGGNDSIDISAGGSNTLNFGASFATNGKDTITGFQTGATADGGDVLAVGAGGFITAGGITGKITNLTGNQAIADNNIFTVNYNAAISGLDFGSATDFGKLFAASGKAFDTTVTSGDTAVIVVQGTDVSQVYFVTAGATTLTDAMVDMVGVLSGLTNGFTFENANFA